MALTAAERQARWRARHQAEAADGLITRAAAERMIAQAVKKESARLIQEHKARIKHFAGEFARLEISRDRWRALAQAQQGVMSPAQLSALETLFAME